MADPAASPGCGAWNLAPFTSSPEKRTVSGLILAGDVLCAAAAEGPLALLDVKDGRPLCEIPHAPARLGRPGRRRRTPLLGAEEGGLICMGRD